MNITRIPLLVILVVYAQLRDFDMRILVMAQHASIIMLSGGSSDGGHHGTG